MNNIALARRRLARLVPVLILALVLASCGSASVAPPTPRGDGASPPEPARKMAAACDKQAPGPAFVPPGAITVDPAIDRDLVAKTGASPPGTTFWLAPGTHTLGTDKFGQIIPKDGNTDVGAPGAILDGRGVNYSAFTQLARGVSIRYLTIQGFVALPDQGVVDHDSGDDLVIEYNTIQNNSGAGIMAGARQQVRGNCLRNNGQYGINAYKAGNTITGPVVEGNEIVGNNKDDWETRIPGCSCSGGVKFWSVDGADVRRNWVHDNRGVGLWTDVNNNDLVIEGNLIEKNDSGAIFHEASYNAIIRNNIIRRNLWVTGKKFAGRRDNFPVAAIYISESGGEPRVTARTDKIDVYANVLQDNWSGITAWENADRFCGSPANPSLDCTRLVASPPRCGQPGVAVEPLHGACRWKTQRVDIHDNRFAFNPAVTGCSVGFAGRMALLANYGTFPDWSPYKAAVVQELSPSLSRTGGGTNTYDGPWMFVPLDTGHTITATAWKSEPYQQDIGSTFTDDSSAGGGC